MSDEKSHTSTTGDDTTSGARSCGDDGDAAGDTVTAPPTDAGHSDAETQTQRNIEDESPA